MDSCAGCRFFRAGFCRRFPPMLLSLARSEHPAGWEQPRVLDSSWCGEFAPAAAQVQPAPPVAESEPAAGRKRRVV